MNIQNWKLFDAKGSNINWTPSPILPLVITSPTGKDAAGYLITNSSTLVEGVCITNGGVLYDNDDVTLAYDYAYEGVVTPFDASIIYKAIPIFGSAYPLVNYVDISTNMVYTNSISEIVLDISSYVETNKYGTLYNFFAATDPSLIANTGWQVPLETDVQTLSLYLGGVSTSTNYGAVGGRLKETGNTYWNANIGAINDTNFSMRGGGTRSPLDGSFSEKNINGYFWTTTISSSTNALAAHCSNSGTTLYKDNELKTRAYSIKLRKTTPSAADLLKADGEECDPYIGNNGKTYRTVKIGTQVWLADMLNETLFRDGSQIKIVTDASEWTHMGNHAYCFYDNDINNAFVDVSIYNDFSKSFVYPSVTFAAAVFLKPVSQGLVETEQIYIFEQDLEQYIRPYDVDNNLIYFEFIGDDNEIQFFDVDEDKVEITWSSVVGFDLSTIVLDTPIQLNIGFKSDYEGVFERTIRVYHLIDGVLYILGEIVVNAEAIGEDERFRTLLTNFGLPDPKDMKDVFKETDINEDLPDWEILNYKSKQMILEHDKIMPFVGTYKGLINAIKWLGYDDIFIKEWFLNVKDHTKLAILVSYDAKDRTQTMLQFNAEQRKTLKKLNQLSLHYCITRETGTIDEWGTPETENCYTYNLKEVFVKLLGLKKWLELNIIGINCRITDLTGEGVYFERVQNLIYETDNIGYNYSVEQTLTPYSPDETSELITGDASIRLTFLELSRTRVMDLPYRFKDMAEFAWNPKDPCVNKYYELDSSSYLADPSSFLLVGATFQYPFVNISDIAWKLSLENKNAAVVGNTLVTNPLFILDNDIRFYDIFDSSSVFHNSSTNLTVMLEKAYLRDPSIDEWTNSIAYSIYPMTDTSSGNYALESSTGVINYFDDYVTFTPDASGRLQYAIDLNYRVPLLSMKYFSSTTVDGSTYNFSDKEYYLDILDGKIAMNAKNVLGSQDNTVSYINWNYDTSLIEQKITSNIIVTSPRMELWRVDPSIYYWADPSGLTGGNVNSLAVDNSIYIMHVNHIGDYNVELYAWDGYNTLFHNIAKETYPVFIKAPTIYTLIDQSCNTTCASTFMTGGRDSFPSKIVNLVDYSLYLSDKLFAIDTPIGRIEVGFLLDSFSTNLSIFNSINPLDINLNYFDIKYLNGLIYIVIIGNEVTVSTAGFDSTSIDMIDGTYYATGLYEVNTLVSQHPYPIYDRPIPLEGLTLNIDSDGNPFIKVPSITYFQDVPRPNSINKFYNLTERIKTIGASQVIVDCDYQSFNSGDTIALVSFDKGKYSLTSENIYEVSTATGSPNDRTLTLSTPVSEVIDISTDVYAINQTLRGVFNYGNVSDNFVADISGYIFSVGQNVAIIVTHTNGYDWGSTYTVIDISGNTHTFDKSLPDFFLNPTYYTLEAKHAFTTYSEMQMTTISATEVVNEFNIYMGDSACQEYYLDNTFTMVNILFDQDIPNQQWYSASDNLIHSNFYYYTEPIVVDISTLVILRAIYDPSTYLLNQKNIWEVINHDSSTILFKVFNESVPYIFDTPGIYDIECMAYDSFGNAITKKYEGLLQVNDVETIIIPPVPVPTPIKYGALYNWYTGTDIKNIAPSGWKVPSKSDLEILVAYLGGDTVAGGKIKETGTTWWDAPNTGATNEALLNVKGSGGRAGLTGGFGDGDREMGISSGFWSSDLYPGYGELNAWCVVCDAYSSALTLIVNSKRDGMPIRLIKESTSLINGQSGTMVSNDGKVIRTICIGTQEYTADNIIDITFKTGDPVKLVTDNTEWSNMGDHAYCFYGNDPTNG